METQLTSVLWIVPVLEEKEDASPCTARRQYACTVQYPFIAGGSPPPTQRARRTKAVEAANGVP